MERTRGQRRRVRVNSQLLTVHLPSLLENFKYALFFMLLTIRFILLSIHFVYACPSRAGGRHSMAWTISVDGRYTNANGQVIPHNHPCCIFLTIFIYFCCRCWESRGSIVGKARASDGCYKRQGHEQIYIFSFTYTLTILFVLHLSRPWTVVYTSEVVVDHLRLFFNFQGKEK